MPSWIVRLTFAAWLGVSTIGAGTLMVGHWYTLPKPAADDAQLGSALEALRPAGRDRGWFAVHVLYSSCPCSVRVLDHLFSSERPDDLEEVVLLVEEDDALEARARAAGFAVVVVTPEALAADYRIEAAPMMVVLDPSDRIRYAGGYTERKQGADIRDIATLRTLRDEAARTIELPLFGCAVSFELQSILDPLKLKY
ncbi:MAG: hypothetical protein RMA76_30315 [Deltaproteobacteria bacterium]